MPAAAAVTMFTLLDVAPMAAEALRLFHAAADASAYDVAPLLRYVSML